MGIKEVLIVDDEEILLLAMKILLATAGYGVKTATDGRAALEAVAGVKPDLVLLDIMLPKIDGFEVCRQIKANDATHDIPVIMLSAKSSREDFIRAEQVGADWYLIKPLKSNQIMGTVQRFLS